MGQAVRGTLVAVVAFALAVAPAGASTYFHPHTVTPDGSAAAFETQAALTADDHDSQEDVYVWRDGSLELASTGPTDGHGDTPAWLLRISDDGERVVFVSFERLVAGDQNDEADIYVRHGTTTELMTVAGTTGYYWPLDRAHPTSDGRQLVFDSTLSLVPDDTDSLRDIYRRRADGGLELVSTGALAFDHSLEGISEDGQRVFEQTSAPLTVSDRDAMTDVYERSTGTVKLVTRGGPTDVGIDPAVFIQATPSGNSVLFWTSAKMTARDLDDVSDVYQRVDGKTRLVSADSDGFSPVCTQSGHVRYPPCYVIAEAQSDNGSHVMISARDPLVSTDVDDDFDAYERTATGVRLLSATQSANGSSLDSNISADGSRAIVATDARLVAADTDSSTDAYAWDGGTPTLLSPGSTAEVWLSLISRDAEHVYFQTEGSLVPADTDGGVDVYVNDGPGPELVTTGPADDGTWKWYTVVGVSADGARFFFTTSQALVAGDGDAQEDLYMRSGGVTTLLSG